MPKVKKEFDKAAYDKAYHKANYKNVSVVFSLDDASKLETAAANAGLTKSAYIKSAVLEKIERES